MLASYCFFNDTATTEIYTLSLHDALPIWACSGSSVARSWATFLVSSLSCCSSSSACSRARSRAGRSSRRRRSRSEEHTSELQSRQYLVCRLLLEKKTAALQHIG